MIYDVIVIGAGPAGVSASVYLKRANKKVLLIEGSAPGGKLNKTKEVSNYLGFSKISGADLAFNLFNQIRDNEIDLVLESVRNIKKSNGIFDVITNKKKYVSKGVVLCMGSSNKVLAISNSEKFLGYGLSYCVLCDAHLYKGKNVVIYGNDDDALVEAKYLVNVCKSVTIIHDKELKTNINSIRIDKLIGLFGKDSLTSIEVLVDGKQKKIDTDALFVSLGNQGLNTYIEDLVTDGSHVIVNEKMETNIDGLYAAGDIIKKDVYQIVTAASEGAMAAFNVLKYLGK